MQHKEHKTPPMKTKVEKVKNQKSLTMRLSIICVTNENTNLLLSLRGQ